MKRIRLIAGTALALAVLTSQWSTLAIPHQVGRLRLEARLFSQIVPTDPGSGVGPGQQGRGFTRLRCIRRSGRGVYDKDISCDDPIAPDNETAIAVHPTNPNLLLAGSNDYQIAFKGNTAILQVPSGFFFSSDGGGTWIDGELPLTGSLGGGDPAPAFDLKHNQMVFASLSFVCGQFAPICTRGNVMFASSPLGPNATAPSRRRSCGRTRSSRQARDPTCRRSSISSTRSGLRSTTIRRARTSETSTSCISVPHRERQLRRVAHDAREVRGRRPHLDACLSRSPDATPCIARSRTMRTIPRLETERRSPQAHRRRS